MVPPPDTPGDEFPDFENMSLEEQMAWLESLAKRQGANEEEFLTSADLDIPIPENAVIDEPGYVPYSISEKPAEQTFEEHGEAEQPEEFEEEGELDFEALSDEIGVVPEGASDPMRWLDSLSVQTGEDVPATASELDDWAGVPEGLADFGPSSGEFGTAMDLGEEEPELESYAEEESELDWAEEVEDEPEAEPVMHWDELEPSEAFDLGSLLGEQETLEGDLESIVAEDMGWLADLAEQPDAALSEAGSPGKIEPEPLEAEWGAEAEIAPDSETLEERWPAETDLEPEPRPEDAVQAGLAGQPDLEDDMSVLAGADPMAWLETLAKRQGAKVEELTTAADLDIPELPEDTVVDEPGYVEYSPFELLSRDEAEETDLSLGSIEEVEEYPDRQEVEALGELGMIDESLSWLSELVTEPDTDVASLLAVEGGAPEFETGETLAPESAEVDPLAGMTDEEIAYAQAHGQLSGEQELAWLKRQAAKLAEARQSEEAAFDDMIGEVEPAEPAELPPWLEEMRSESLFDEALLEDEPSLPGVADLEELLDETAVEEIDFEEVSIPESELEAFLRGEFVPDEPDQLAEALDAEYDRRMAEDDSEPEWYAQAVAQVAAETTGPADERGGAGDEDLVEAVPVEMPDWLKMTAEEPEPSPEEEIPGWLTEPILAEAETGAGDVPEWLSEVSQEPAEEEVEWEPVPDLPEFAEWMAHEETPVEMRPDVMAQAAESIPQVELFNTYRRRLEEDPHDFANRLGLARALHANQELAPSMDQYEALIDNAQLLEDVSNDLTRLVEEHPETPRIRRLLGDAYMHQGKLQDALDAYRSALDLL